jgi:pimeloyl-ACP methyl ester carboxylesterase
MAAQAYRTESFVHEGHRLVYDVYGEEGPLLVYLHGLLLDADVNRGIAAALADRGHRVVLLDLLGHGRSDAPVHAAEYRIDSYADQVFALLDELGETDAVLGGVSLGANVSLFAAARRPERVRGLVLEMPVLEWAVPAAALLFAPMLLVAHYGRPVAGVVAAGVRRLPRTPSDSLNSLLSAAGSPPERMAAVLHGILVGPVAPTQEERSRIEAPTLVLAHRNDLIHPFDDAHRLVERMPNASLVPAHSPVELRLRPERLTAEVGTFLDDLADRPAPKRTSTPRRRTSRPKAS